MYEKNHPSAMRRSDDEFLRRMMKNDLAGNSLPTMNSSSPLVGSPTPTVPNTGNGRKCTGGCGGESDSCPPSGNAMMPSLAMVYSPEQDWQCLYTPQEALQHGTLFRELFKPFEGRSIYRRAR